MRGNRMDPAFCRQDGNENANLIDQCKIVLPRSEERFTDAEEIEANLFAVQPVTGAEATVTG